MENDPLVAQMEDLEVQRTLALLLLWLSYVRMPLTHFHCSLLCSLPPLIIIAGAVHSLRPAKAALHPAKGLR